MNLIVAIVIAILVYLLQKRLYATWWNRNLDVSIAFEDLCIREGHDSALTETIYNGKWLPLPVFHVKFSVSRFLVFEDCENATITDEYYRNDAFSILGYRKVTRRLPFYTQKRGLYGIASQNIIARDFFMTTNFACSERSDVWLYVLPGRVENQALTTFCTYLLGEMETRRNLMEDPYTFRGIREYTYGDTMGKINWKNTAKSSRLMVNMYAYSSEQRVKILLNMEPNIMMRTEYLQEMSIRMAGTVADFFVRHKIPVSISSNGMDVQTKQCEKVDFGCSLSHGQTVDQYLARIGENAGLETFLEMLNHVLRNPEENVTYIVISPYYKEDLLGKLDFLYQQHQNVQMLVPCYDIQDRSAFRPYMHSMEVKWNET